MSTRFKNPYYRDTPEEPEFLSESDPLYPLAKEIGSDLWNKDSKVRHEVSKSVERIAKSKPNWIPPPPLDLSKLKKKEIIDKLVKASNQIFKCTRRDSPNYVWKGGYVYKKVGKEWILVPDINNENADKKCRLGECDGSGWVIKDKDGSATIYEECKCTRLKKPKLIGHKGTVSFEGPLILVSPLKSGMSILYIFHILDKLIKPRRTK